uniref:Uncharacterized protein n=1 Tax=Chromera velia CCMP2878 TaxID=1169474 RepID=A0A0G4FDI3_9ALVE|eukprot:Cvel_3199.t1-p1 / transcript=Cvel_3199.t1 / gene=Cvel_3199 / organism=Chromera_velia_CCMP2878 / gene_product=hypothetical protein / transcript_product=hypothetical protein / location=Cvel_scaffold125:2012-7493(+) / protein_length=625 / sequence_SO=supercontig / SO=protein_coding / is_pseudo=false
MMRMRTFGSPKDLSLSLLQQSELNSRRQSEKEKTTKDKVKNVKVDKHVEVDPLAGPYNEPTDLDDDDVHAVNSVVLPVIRTAATILLDATQETELKTYKILTNAEDFVEFDEATGAPVWKWKRKDGGETVEAEEVRILLPDGRLSLVPVEVEKRGETTEEFEKRKLNLLDDVQWTLHKIEMELEQDALRLREKTFFILDLVNRRDLAPAHREEAIRSIAFTRPSPNLDDQAAVPLVGPLEVSALNRFQRYKHLVKTALVEQRELQKKYEMSKLSGEAKRIREKVEEYEKKREEMLKKHKEKLKELGPNREQVEGLKENSANSVDGSDREMALGARLFAAIESDRVDDLVDQTTRVLYSEPYLNMLLRKVQDVAVEAVRQRHPVLDVAIMKTVTAAMEVSTRLQRVQKLSLSEGTRILRLLYDENAIGESDQDTTQHIEFAKAALENFVLPVDEGGDGNGRTDGVPRSFLSRLGPRRFFRALSKKAENLKNKVSDKLREIKNDIKEVLKTTEADEKSDHEEEQRDEEDLPSMKHPGELLQEVRNVAVKCVQHSKQLKDFEETVKANLDDAEKQLRSLEARGNAKKISQSDFFVKLNLIKQEIQQMQNIEAFMHEEVSGNYGAGIFG